MKALPGDFNGDGKADVMKFDVPAGGSASLGLWVGLSEGGSFKTTQWATWTANQRMRVLAGDFNGDGKTDVMKFDVPPAGSATLGLWVGLSDGVGSFNTTQWATWTTNQRMKVLAGDFNGDGKTDVMKFDIPPAGSATLGLWVGLSDGVGSFNTAQWATWTTNARMKVLAGDFNGDGKTDVMKFDIPPAGSATLGLWVGLSDGVGSFNTTQWATWTTNDRMKVLAGDFNGDGKTDVMKFDVPPAGGARLGLWVGLSDGAGSFNTTQWADWYTYQRMVVLAGDFDGDSKTDVMKFDVPAPASAEARCSGRGGVWIDLINHCSMTLVQFRNLTHPLVHVYKLYFAVVGSNATMTNLRVDQVQRLSAHFSANMLATVAYGNSHHTSSDNTTMTDCAKIYFPSGSGHVTVLRSGTLFDKDTAGNLVNAGTLGLLLHELTHVQQCLNWGGRESYAIEWFSQLTATTIEELITNTRNVSNRKIHDAMPMEEQAAANASTILPQF